MTGIASSSSTDLHAMVGCIIFYPMIYGKPESGAARRTRTSDPLITNEMLYQLS